MSFGPEFFELPSVQRIMKRAARSAGVPLSVHLYEDNHEADLVVGWDSCAVCTHVNKTVGGRRACRKSRHTGAMLAMSGEVPNAYPCHMGLGVVSVAPRAIPGMVLTFGPYCPASDAEGLENCARTGLFVLFKEVVEELPFSLDDVPRVRVGSVTSVAEWTAEELNREAERLETPAAQPETVPARLPAKQSIKAESRPVHEEVVVALSGGSRAPLRGYLRGCLAEAGERATAARRSGAVTVALSRLLELCQIAGADLTLAWPAFVEFSGKAFLHASDRELIDAAARVLATAVWPSTEKRIGRRRAETGLQEGDTGKKPAPVRLNDVALNAILLPRISEKVPLAEVARELGVSPSAITHRLQRHFNLCYSEYLGRLRAEKAKELLRRTRLGVAEVAERVGIGDPSNLGRLFRRHVGMSPKEYRTLHGRRS